MTKTIDRMHPHNGRYLLESDKMVNIANIASRFQRSLTPLNAVQVAEGYPVVSLKSNYGFSDLRDKRTIVGSGTVTNNVGDGRYLLSTGTTPNSVAILDSVERGRYVSGSIGLPGIGTKIAQDIQGGESARWGYFNDDGGFGFGVDIAGVFVFRRYLAVDTKLYQQDWDDPLDGTGPSGAVFSLNDVDIYRMPFRWYGAGPVVFEIAGNATNSDTLVVAEISAGDGEPIVSDPNLPIRMEIRNDINGRDISSSVYGRQFSILGRYAPNRRSTGVFKIGQSIGTTFVPLVSFRQKQDYASVSVKSGAIESLVSNSNIILQVRVGATLGGATYNALTDPDQAVPATETAVEFDIDATTITGGQAIFVGLADAGVGTNAEGKDIDLLQVDLPVFENITLCARAVSGTATVTTVFGCREEW